MPVIATVHALPSSSCHIKGRKFVGRDWRNNSIAEHRVLEEPTMWRFPALLFLLGFLALDVIVKSTGAHTVIIEAALTQ
jgi:hypothetical protein